MGCWVALLVLAVGLAFAAGEPAAVLLVIGIAVLAYRLCVRPIARSQGQADITATSGRPLPAPASHPGPSGDLASRMSDSTGPGQPAPTQQLRAFLVAEGTSARYELRCGQLSLGRDAANDVVLAGDALISRRHASLTFDGRILRITDVGSSNGTWINGKRLPPNAPMTLLDGDLVVIGAQQLRIHLREGIPEASQPRPTPASPPSGTGLGTPPARPALPSRVTPATPPPPGPSVRSAQPGSVRGMRWMGSGERLVVGAYTIEDPLTYACGSGRDADASCIDLRLFVGRPVAEPKGALGYWPQYAAIGPSQRANYLSWLATGKKAPLGDIGYAFLYFYGLERRALVDRADIPTVLSEVVRLLGTYPESGSFRGYLGSFIAYVIARVGLEHLNEPWFEHLFLRNPKILNDTALSVALAWVYRQDRPLPLALALEVAGRDPRSPRSVVLDRVPEQFHALFGAKYREQFGDGMKLRVAARELAVQHHPASPSLLRMRYGAGEAFPAVRVPHVMGITSQFRPLVAIWTECVEELKPLSRHAAKGTGPRTREAYRILPEALKEITDHPDKPRWEAVVARHAGEDGPVLLPVSELAALLGMDQRPKLTPSQSEDLAVTAHEVGFQIVPDPRITARAYAWGDTVCVYRPVGRPTLPSDGSYRAAALMLELGIAVAAADGQADEAEVAHVTSFLEGQFLLGEEERRRLEAYQAVLLRQPLPLAAIGKRLQATLNGEQRGLVGRFLVGVAAANGVVERAEIAALRGAYRALDLEPGLLDELLTELLGKSGEPVVVLPGRAPSRPGEPIPERVAAEEREIVLDPALLHQIMAETEEVSRLLGQATASADAEWDSEVDGGAAPAPDAAAIGVAASAPIPGEPSQPPGADEVGREESADDATETAAAARGAGEASLLDTMASESAATGPAPVLLAEVLDTLDARYHPLLSTLVTREEWSVVEFGSLVRSLGLMPAATVEGINLWADEYLGDFLIEEGETYLIHRELLEENA